MATPTDLKYVNSNSCVVTRSTRRQLELNARDNGVSNNRYQTRRYILPISNDVSNNATVLTRSGAKNLQLFAGEYKIPSDSRKREGNMRRKKNKLIIPDLSKCSSIPPRDEELGRPEELKKEADCPSPHPLFKKSHVTCVEDGAEKSGYSPVHCETEMQPSTTVDQNAQDSTCGEDEAGKLGYSPAHSKTEMQPSTTVSQNGQNETARWESPSSTTIQNDLNSETSAKRENASKHVLVTPYKHPRGTSKGQNEIARWESPSSTTIQNVKSATKLPNFANIHKKQFEKMESVIEWKQRKQIRSNRMLMSPTAKSTFCFKIPEPSPLTENVFKFTAMQKLSVENEGVHDLNKKKAFNLGEMKKCSSKQNIIAAQAKESVIKKLPHVSRGQKRAQERTYLKGVRLNKRFHLQMEMRKLR